MLSRKELFHRSSKEPIEAEQEVPVTNRATTGRNEPEEENGEVHHIAHQQTARNRPRTNSVSVRAKKKDNKTIKIISANSSQTKGGFESYKGSIKLINKVKEDHPEVYEMQNRLMTANKDRVLIGSKLCNRAKERKNLKPKETKEDPNKNNVKANEQPIKILDNRKHLLEIQRKKLKYKFSKGSIFKEESKAPQERNSLEPLKRNIVIPKTRLLENKSNSNLKRKNLNMNQYKGNYCETFKMTNFPEFTSPPFAEEFPATSNFKYSTLLPGKTEGLFKQKETESDVKAVAIFPIIDKIDKSGSSEKKNIFSDQNETDKEVEAKNPLLRKLPKVKKRSGSSEVEREDHQAKQDNKFESWRSKSKGKTSRSSKKRISRHKALLKSIRKAISSPKNKDSSFEKGD